MSKHISSQTVGFSTLVEILRWRALQQQDQRAYTFLVEGELEEISLTYGELDEQSRAIGALLQSLGLRGERALLLYPSGLEFIAAFFGCLYAGVIAVPAYPPRLNRPMPRIQVIGADAQATVALTTTAILSNAERQFVQTSNLESLHWITTDNVARNLAEEWREPAVSSDTLAYLQYTSGSTSTPKGVMVSHENVLHNSAYINYVQENAPDSVSVTWLPHFHDMGLIEGVIQPLYCGFPCFLMSPGYFLQRPARWLQAISRYKATNSGGPNFAYDLCVRKLTPEERVTLDLSSWRVAYNGAEPIRKDTLERFAETFEPCGFHWSAFYPVYGLAEASLIVSSGRKQYVPVFCTVEANALEQNRVVQIQEDQQRSRTLVASGRVMFGMKVAIVNPESLTLCLPTEVGEIWLMGPSITQGYWNRHEETEHTFRAYLADSGEGPFLRTGDLGFLKDGELFVTGRFKDLIIIRGRNHYPQDIEVTVEQSHPALRLGCSAAFAVEVEGEEQIVVAQEVERHYFRNLDVDEVIRAIRWAVSEQHDLHVYAVLLLKTGSIPKTSSGKIQRHACQTGFLSGNLSVVGEWRDTVVSERISLDTSADGDRVTASTDMQRKSQKAAIEDWLVSRLARRLGLAATDIDTNHPFSYYGLGSVDAVGLTGDLENWLERSLPPTLTWDYPSIERLAQYLASEASESGSQFETMTYQSSEDEELNQILTALEQLSEEAAQTALKSAKE